MFLEVISGRSPLVFDPISPLQTYLVPRGYKGSAAGRSKVANYRQLFEVENGFLSRVDGNLFIHKNTTFRKYAGI